MLEGKRAIVTGAGRGIGRAVALAFAREGADLALLARSADELASVAAEAQALGRRARALPCDLAQPEALRAGLAEALEFLGGADLLVNNAALARFAPVGDLAFEDWQAMLDLNLTAPFLAVQAVLPGMIEQGGGRIINISSVAAHKCLPGQSGYVASKHGLNGLTRNLALELREHGIGVHAISPGGVDTRLAREAMPERDKRDWLRPEDVAEAALYLAGLPPRAAVDEIVLRRFGSTPLNA